jgi:DNA topoisomerase-2
MKTTEHKYKKLDEISHVLARPGRYIGSISQHTADTYIMNTSTKSMELSSITWCPGFIKLFDEVITNSVDFSKTTEGAHLDTIKVNIDKDSGLISVWDNGGITVTKHKEYDQYIPEMIFELRAGSNFDDTEVSHGAGQNGEGAALTNIFSTQFIVETADGINAFKQIHSNNSRNKDIPIVTKSRGQFTKISYLTEFSRFNQEVMADGDYVKLIKRVYDIVGCNPKIKMFLNDTPIHIKSFEDYIKLYTADYVFDSNDNWRVGISKSNGSFSHVSFVNSTETVIGGFHISYIADQIIVKLREYIKKKHKIDVKPSEIKNHLNLFIDCTIDKPRYSSQTKEDLITEIKSFGTSFEVNDKFIAKIIKSDIVDTILDWAMNKAEAAMRAELRKLNKDADKANPNRVPKFEDAIEQKQRERTILMLLEGDSAAKPLLAIRGSLQYGRYIGIFPLKGKPLNVSGITAKKLLENQEFQNLLIITGLKIGEKVTSTKQLRFGKIVMFTDQDLDGTHIRGLMLNNLYTFWPELFTLGMVYSYRTPLIKATCGKDVFKFYNEEDFIEWSKNTTKKYTSKWYKGLGTSTDTEFKECFEDMENNMIRYEIQDEQDIESIKLAFSKEKGQTDKRKAWLNLITPQNEG